MDFSLCVCDWRIAFSDKIFVPPDKGEVVIFPAKSFAIWWERVLSFEYSGKTHQMDFCVVLNDFNAFFWAFQVAGGVFSVISSGCTDTNLSFLTSVPSMNVTYYIVWLEKHGLWRCLLVRSSSWEWSFWIFVVQFWNHCISSSWVPACAQPLVIRYSSIFPLPIWMKVDVCASSPVSFYCCLYLEESCLFKLYLFTQYFQI